MTGDSERGTLRRRATDSYRNSGGARSHHATTVGVILGLATSTLLARKEAADSRLPRARRGDELSGDIRLLHTRLTINAPPAAVYRYWRRLDRLPRFSRRTSHRQTSGTRLRAYAVTPWGRSLQWSSELVHDVPHQRLGWEHGADSEIPHHGEIWLHPTADGGTECEVLIRYGLPGGMLARILYRWDRGFGSASLLADLRLARKTIEWLDNGGTGATGIADQGLGREPVTPPHG